MSMMINTNIMAINAQRNLSLTNDKLGHALEQLSSGLRINRSADDAAGLAISEKMRALIRGMQQGSRNGQDGISMIQTAEGALGEVHNILQRIRELTVQAGNSTLSNSDRIAIGDEIASLKLEIDNIANRTTFNGLSLLTGSLSTNLDQTTSTLDGAAVTGATTGVVSIAASDIDISRAKAGMTYTMAGDGANKLTLSDTTGISQSITVNAMATANGVQVLDFTALGVKVTLRHDNTTNNVLASELAKAAAGNSFSTLTVVVSGSGAAATFQVGANATDVDTVNFTDSRSTALGTGVGNMLSDKITNNTAVDSIAKANALLGITDAAIDQVSAQRALLGATQNQLQAAVNSMGVVIENLSASESRIRDADIAKVSSELVARQIMQQAGVSVLAQSNTASQAVLQLLKGM